MYIYIFTLWIAYFLALLSRLMNGKKINSGSQKYILHSQGKQNIISKMFFGFSFMVIWLVAGLRVDVGTDYSEYKLLFHHYNSLSFNSQVNIELLYFYVNKIIGIFTDNVQWLFVITSFIIYFLYYNVAKKESNYYELSVFLFITFGFYFSTFNIIRQWIACAIVFYAFYFLFNKKIMKFIVLSILASFFHITALVVIPAAFIILKLKKNIMRISIMIIATIISFMPNTIIGYINIIFSSISSNPKYFKYLNELAISEAQGFVYPLFCLIVFIAYFVLRKNISLNNLRINYYVNILTLAYVTSVLGQKLLIFSRLHFYFLPILILFVPNIIEALDKNDKKVIVYISILLFGFIFMIYFLDKNGGNPLPYNSVFNVNK